MRKMLETTTVIETPVCSVCGYKGRVEVLASGVRARNAGALIQDAFPELDKGIREQIKSGIHPECWTNLFG
jgi:hypothetical protein